MSPAGFLALALLAPTAPPADRGDEWTYTGTVTEEVDRPGNRFRRAHDLELRVMALERRGAAGDYAVLTLMRRADDGAVSGAAGAVIGAKVDRTPAPPAARLDLVRCENGSHALLAPPGQPPLRLDGTTPTRALRPVPLDTFAPSELGMFVSRAGERWRAAGDEVIAGERCERLETAQQTPDWDRPVGGQTAWQRAEVVWVSARDGVVRKAHRLIRHRDGIGPNFAVVIETKYELTGQSKAAGRVYDRSRREIELAYAAAAELAELRPSAARLGPRPFEIRLARLDQHVRDNDPGTPYREAVLAVRRQLDAARAGEATAPAIGPPPTAAEPVEKSEAVAVGKLAPDFQTGSFRLADHRGKPAVLVFFKPGTVTTDLSLAIADALRKRYADRAAVAPLVVFADPAAGLKDRDRLKLTVPVHDGAAAGRLYGVDTFPRFFVIDSGGVLRWAFAGVGPEIGYLVREQVDGLLTPSAATVAPAGTAYPAGATGAGSAGRR